MGKSKQNMFDDARRYGQVHTIAGSPPSYDLQLKKPLWKIARQNTEGLFPFDGELERYRSWKSRIRDHTSEEWYFWRVILDHATYTNQPITNEVLSLMDFNQVSGQQLSSDV